MMSRLATLVIIGVLGVYMVYRPPAATIPQAGDWTTRSLAAAAGALMAPAFAYAVFPLAMGPDPGGKSGTQAIPDGLEAGTSIGSARTSGHAAAARNLEEAEYEAQLRECDALAGDARNHCIVYVKLRTERS